MGRSERLVQGHRVLCPSARTLGVVSLTITGWPLALMVVTWTYPTPRNLPWWAARSPGPECRGRHPTATRAGRGRGVGHAAEDAGFPLRAVPVNAPAHTAPGTGAGTLLALRRRAGRPAALPGGVVR